MDPDPPSSNTRKVKFAPKGPTRRAPKPTITPKIDAAAEDDGGDEEAEQRTLLRRIVEHSRRGPKVEKKSSVQVAFSHIATSSSSLRTFGNQREKTNNGTESANKTGTTLEKRDEIFSTSGMEVDETFVASYPDAGIVKKKREYEEPWDYINSNYPITLPLRRPNSGNPELLDKEEFESAVEYDESSLCAAKHLGLMDQDDSRQMLLFQFPSNLPLNKRRDTFNKNLKVLEKPATNQKETAGTSSAKGKEIAGTSIIPRSANLSRKETGLEELPEGYMGKMLVYKSGKVKLKLGDILYDISPGSDCIFAQNVVAMNTLDRSCCELGDLTKRVVVSPDIDSMLENVISLR